MDPQIVLRTLGLAGTYVACLAVIWPCRRALPSGTRLAFDFCLLLYAVTFHAGSSWLFLFQEDAINAYFGNAMAPPSGVSYTSVLLMSSLPLVVVPVSALLVHRLLGPIKPLSGSARQPVRETAIWLGVAISLVGIAAVNGELIFSLVRNAILELGATSTLGELYARRREALESLSALDTGLLYSTLPACAALLLFHAGTKHRLAARVLGAVLAALTVLVNAGLFQIAPVLAFGLMCAFCLIVRHRDRIKPRHMVAAGVAAMLVLGSYLSIKSTERDDNVSVALQLALRMPVALPYLFQMADQDPELVESSDGLAFDLGEFMFPELRTRERFIAMPQPSFVNAWFQSGPVASLATLIVIGALVAMGGRWLHRAMAQKGTRPVMVAIALAPALYYSFQVTLAEVLVSSYGVVYVILPLVLVWGIGHLLRLAGPAPHRKIVPQVHP
jgi:hypothetical protein